MCETCGCSDPQGATLIDMQTGQLLSLNSTHHHHKHEHHHHEHEHHHHEHEHHHSDTSASSQVIHIPLEQEVLAKNNRLAEHNRRWLTERNILTLNLVSSPGAGKTTLLERTLRDLHAELDFFVVEGDQATSQDGQRIRATGRPVVQINTGAGCHLDAAMLARGLHQLNPPAHSVLMIENVGNLVCPALFDLGERAKVVIASVTEGADKPIKYPHMFRASTLMLLNKIDLLPYVEFDMNQCLGYVRQVNPHLRVIPISATRGDGLAEWYAWLRDQRTQ